MTITRQQVEHVAKLARLGLSDAEKDRLVGQLARIMEHFNELAAVDTEGVEPMAHVLPITNVLRPDEIVQPMTRAAMLSNAPAEENGYMRVPKIGD